MDRIVIEGGNRLNGTVTISGSKNAVLPIMAATLLAEGEYRIGNVPNLRDVRTMSKLLQSMGVNVRFENHTLHIDTRACSSYEAPYDLVKTMRASIYVLGPLVSRHGVAKVSLPGGCAWGPRPVNLHIEGLRKLGAEIMLQEGYVVAEAGRLKGAHVSFDVSSVGATGNILMAAVLAEGKTLIENAAIEPEITALVQFLQGMGAQIHGVGTKRLEIEGVNALHPTNQSVIPDRIEAGTFMVAGHMAGGDIRIEGVEPEHLIAVINKLRDSGASIEEGQDWIRVQSKREIRPVDMVTAIYPGFPTDMQAQWMALMSVASGSSKITDTIFNDRFTHVAELQRLGAHITLKHNVASISGADHLTGAPVMSTDLRASASLILAGLVAEGRTTVSRVYHIDRGYERIEEKLKGLGAKIWRDQEPLIT